MALKGKAGPTFVWLIEVDTLISGNNELQVLRRVAQGGAAQTTTMGVQLHTGIVLSRNYIGLPKVKKKLAGSL